MSEEIVRLAGVVDIMGVPQGVRALRTLDGQVDKTQTGLDGFTRRAAARGEAMSAWGRKTSLAVTAPILAIGVAAGKAGMEFDAKMDAVAAKSGATGQALKGLRELAIDLGAKTSFSARDAAEGMEMLAAAGMKNHEIMSAMPGLLDGAAASGEGLAEVSGIVANSLAQFNLKAIESGRVVDVLAMASNETQGSIGSMGEALKYAGTGAAQLGFSIEQTTGMLSMMVKAGIEGSQAGTSFRFGMQRVAQGALASERALSKLGKVSPALKEIWKSTAPVPEKVALMADEFQKLDGKTRTVAASLIFGTEASSGMLEVMKNGAPAIEAWTDRMEAAEGQARKMGETMRDNLKGDLEQLGGALESAFIGLQSGNDGLLRGLAQDATGLVNAFSDLSPAAQQTALMVAGLAAAAGPASWAIGGMIGGVTSAAGAVGLLGAGIGRLALSLGTVAPGLATLGLLVASNPLLTGALAVGAAVTAVAGLAIVLNDSGEEARGAAEATKGYEQAIQDLAATQFAMTDAAFGVIDADRRHKEAINAAAAALEQYGPKSRQYSDAQLEVQRTAHLASAAMDRYGKSVSDNIAEHNEAGAQISQTVADLQKLGGQLDTARARFDRFKAGMEGVPKSDYTDWQKRQYEKLSADVTKYEHRIEQSKKRLDQLRGEQNSDLKKRVAEANRIFEETGKVVPGMGPYIKGVKDGTDKAAGHARSGKEKANRELGGVGKGVKPDLSAMIQGVEDALDIVSEMFSSYTPPAIKAPSTSGGGGGGGGGNRRPPRGGSSSSRPPAGGRPINQSSYGVDKGSSRYVGAKVDGQGGIDYLGNFHGTPTAADALLFADLQSANAWVDTNNDNKMEANTAVQAFIRGRIEQNTTLLDQKIARNPLLPGLIKAAQKKVNQFAARLRQLQKELRALEKELRAVPSGNRYKAKRKALRDKIRLKKEAIGHPNKGAGVARKLKLANDDLQKLTGERDTIADEILGIAAQIDADNESLIDPSLDDASRSGPDELTSALLAQSQERERIASSNLALSEAAFAAFSGSGDIGMGGANAFQAARNTTLILSSPIPYSPQQIAAAAALVNVGQTMGVAGDKNYSGLEHVNA